MVSSASPLAVVHSASELSALLVNCPGAKQPRGAFRFATVVGYTLIPLRPLGLQVPAHRAGAPGIAAFVAGSLPAVEEGRAPVVEPHHLRCARARADPIPNPTPCPQPDDAPYSACLDGHEMRA